MSWFSLWQCKPAIIYWEEKQNIKSTSVQDNWTVQMNCNIPPCLVFCWLPANMYLFNRDNAELRLTLYHFFCFILSALFDVEAVVSYTTFAHCNDLKTVSKQKPYISFFGSFSLPWAFFSKLSLIPFFPMVSPISWVTIRGGAFSAVTRVKNWPKRNDSVLWTFFPVWWDGRKAHCISVCETVCMSSSPTHWTARKIPTLSCSDFQQYLSYSFLLKTLLFIVAPRTLLNSQASLVAQTIKNLPAMQETQIWSLGCEDPLEKGMVPHSNILAWRIAWTEEPGRLKSTGSQRVGHNWANNTFTSCTEVPELQSRRGSATVTSDSCLPTCWASGCGRQILFNTFPSW